MWIHLKTTLESDVSIKGMTIREIGPKLLFKGVLCWQNRFYMVTYLKSNVKFFVYACYNMWGDSRELCGVQWRYLVEEALAELVHGALQLAALGLPLLVVSHRLGSRSLPCGGPGVVVHVVESAPLVHSFFPAGCKTNIGVKIGSAFRQHFY